MVRDEKLDFWLKHGLNVLFEGRHGVGKTAMITGCFDRNGLVLGETFLYFSAATLDPWVDLVGVPRERVGNDGVPYLDLVRPRQLARGAVQALFFDEFNRSHKKTRNAVMELLQFKSINGKPFPNLRVVWAAVNPDDGRYDVEPLDPAQMDRFHVTIAVPYRPSLTWFTQRFGEQIARGAVAWWDELPDEEKEKVSPRRLEYALRMSEAGGDIRDVLPASSNVTRLHEMLRSGPASERAEALFQARDVEAARLFFAHENNLTASIRHVTGSDARMGFFLPLLPRERLAALMSEQDKVCSFVCRHHAHYPVFAQVMRDILTANQNRSLVKKIRRAFDQDEPPEGGRNTAAPAHFNRTVASPRPWMDLVAVLKGSPMRTAAEQRAVYREAVVNIPEGLTAEGALAALELFDGLASRCCAATLGGGGMRLLVNMVNHAVARLAAAEGIGWDEILRQHGGRLSRLLEKLKDAGLSDKLFRPGK